MELAKGITALDLCIYLPASKTLVIADTHLGYEEMMNRKGVMMPRFQLDDTLKTLDRIFKMIGHAQRVVITGDFKHEIGQVTTQEWKDSLAFIDFLRLRCDELAIIKGNHDVFLGPIARKKGIILMDHLFLPNSSIYISHGDKVPADDDYRKAKTLIIGHEHPAITLHEGPRKEKFKCFLKGTYKRKTLIVMPSFFSITAGTDVLEEELLSPLISDIDACEVFAVADEIYAFGTVKKLRKKMS